MLVIERLGELVRDFYADLGLVGADDGSFEVVCIDEGCVRDERESPGEGFAFAGQGRIAVETVFLADEKRADRERRDNKEGSQRDGGAAKVE